MCARIQLPNHIDELRSKTRGGVHGNVKCHQIGVADCVFAERLARQIHAHYLRAARAQPSSRRRQAEWLMAKFVRGDEDDVHGRGLSSVCIARSAKAIHIYCRRFAESSYRGLFEHSAATLCGRR